MNTAAPWPTAAEAAARVLEIQTKLHRWTTNDPDRRFDDLDNLVCGPAFLVLAARLFGAASAGLCGDVAALDGDDGWVERLKEAVRLAA